MSTPSESIPAFLPTSDPSSFESTPTTFTPASVPSIVPNQPAPTYRLYRPPRTAANTPRELPESYFTPTTADLKAAQDSLTARVNALSNAPLRTQAMRDAEAKAKHLRYPTTTIRVKFSDRSQLEKTFPSTDKIRSVYAFVRGVLREDVKPIKFVLFQTPPKRELKVSEPNIKNLSLLELQLAPSSVLHLKFEDDSLNHMTVPPPLDESVLALAEDFPIPPDPEEQVTAASTSKAKASGSSTHTLGGGQVKVPKWLKLGKK